MVATSKPFLLRAAVFLLLSASMLAAQAAPYMVSPLRFWMNPGQRSTTATVNNASTEPLMLRAELYAWSKKDGKDHLVPSSDLLITPPIMRIPPKSQQTVRIGFAASQAPKLTTGKGYRLKFVQVSARTDAQKAEAEVEDVPITMAITTLLTIDVPVIIQPRKIAKNLRYALISQQADEAVVEIENAGNAVQHIEGALLEDAAGLALSEADVHFYALPGEKSRITLKLKPGLQLNGARVKYNEAFQAQTAELIQP